jgi:ATP-dependent DNA ligase
VLFRERGARWVGLAAILVSGLLVGCGSKVTQDNFDKIQAGMTREEVKSILGEPTESSGVGVGAISGDAWVWKKDGTVITIQFVGGKVLAKQFGHKAP